MIIIVVVVVFLLVFFFLPFSVLLIGSKYDFVLTYIIFIFKVDRPKMKLEKKSS